MRAAIRRGALASYPHEDGFSWTFLILVALWLTGILGLWMAIVPNGTWPNIAAQAVWLASVGTLLTGAVRSRKPVQGPAEPLGG